MSAAAPMLVLDGVSKRFERRPNLGERIAAALGAAPAGQVVHAVDGVSLSIAPRETLALVGESGCGKSTLGRVAAGIHAPTSGRALLSGAPLMTGGPRPRKATTRVQMVFQDPFASLNPRMRVAEILAEGPLAHGLVARDEAAAYVAGWLELNLFVELRRDLGLTCLFISHDLGVVRHVSDRVAIMYLGRVVETGPTAEIFAAPRHPYTRALLDSVPRLRRGDDGDDGFRPIAGEIPSPLAPPPGCHFRPRCPLAEARCRAERPVLEGAAGRQAACHLAGRS